MEERYFKDINGTVDNESINIYKSIKKYAKQHHLKNTLKSLNIAPGLYVGNYRNSSGQPYLIHPLASTDYLIKVNAKNAIYDMELSKLHSKSLAKHATTLDEDILLSVAILHDTLEDCKEKLPGGGQEFVEVYGLHPDILNHVIALTKNKDDPNYSLEGYFAGICEHWIRILVKFSDRINNCSTINVFSSNRMERYVRETVKFFYPMSSETKALYPDLSRIVTIIKYYLVSVCETAASSLGIVDIINGYPRDYEKTYTFIKGFCVGSGGHQNTLKALPLAKKYYSDLTRKSGDPFIIHPLRVASFLLSLKIDDDVIIATALLHEIIKRTHLEDNGLEIVTKYNIDINVLHNIRELSNVENYTIDKYYDVIRQNPDLLLLHLSNKAHTCTVLIDAPLEEIKEYVNVYENYICPLSDYGMVHYPQYSYSIEIMHYHISSIVNMVKALKPF